jgi:hypothetical protein
LKRTTRGKIGKIVYNDKKNVENENPRTMKADDEDDKIS